MVLQRLGEAVRQSCLVQIGLLRSRRSALLSFSSLPAAAQAEEGTTKVKSAGQQPQRALKLHEGHGRSFSTLGATTNPQDRGFNWNLAQGFLFDIDGTLTETDPLHHEAFRECLLRTGSKLNLDEEYFTTHCAGRSNAAITEHLLPHASAREREIFIIEKEASFFELSRAKIKPIAGIVEFLDWIKQRKGVKLAAVTNNTRPSATMVLETLQLKETFDLLVFAEDCTRSKPHPDPYLAAMQMLELDQPERCVAFEDSAVGATAAVAAQLHTVGILSSQTEQTLREAGVKQTIKDYHELLHEIITQQQSSP